MKIISPMNPIISTYVDAFEQSKLLLLLLIATTFSCSKMQDEMSPMNPKKNIQDTKPAVFVPLSSPNLLYEETFESMGPFFYPGTLQIGTTYGFSVVSNLAYQGQHAARFELRDTDPLTSSGTRSEAKYPALTNTDRWYSFSVYFPSADYAYDSKSEIINQWHQGAGTNPSISLITKSDKLSLETRSIPGSYTQFPLGNLVKDKWQNYVLHIIHSNSSKGLVEIWRDGVKIFTHTGANCYDLSRYEKPYWKMGIYKWEWNGSGTSDTKKRVIYFDNIREGNELATYADMVISAPTVFTSPAEISSFTLVNATTEKDIYTITEGNIISLSKLGVSKLNIRANPNTAVGSVVMVLSGQENKSYKDNTFPYALNGDDGRGNYYSGTWAPPPTGDYTLTATPYSETNATGLLGKKATIHFTITK